MLKGIKIVRNISQEDRVWFSSVLLSHCEIRSVSLCVSSGSESTGCDSSLHVFLYQPQLFWWVIRCILGRSLVCCSRCPVERTQQGKQRKGNHLQANPKGPTGRFHSNHLWRRSRREGGKEARGLPSCPGANCPPRRMFFFSTLHFSSDSYSWSISADRGWPLLNCLVSLLLTNHIACQLGAQMDPPLPAARWFVSRGCGCHRIQR